MLIDTIKGEKSVASTGLAGTALGLAIPGTIALVNQLSGCNGNGGGLLGGLFGGNCNCSNNTVTNDTRVISALESEIARINAERYADGIGINTFKESKTMFEKANADSAANYKELAQFVAALDKQVAVDKAVADHTFRALDGKIDCTAQGIYNYVDSKFVPGKLVMPKSSICPEPLAACTPVVVNPQVIATTAATTEGEVALNTVRVSK